MPAEASATAPEIAEALTWTSTRPSASFTPYLARRGGLAANAIAKLEDCRDRKEAATQGDLRESHPMRVSTAIILGLGIIPLGWGAFTWTYLVVVQPPSWDIGIPWTGLAIAIGAGIIGTGLLKLVLLDWLWGARF